MFKHCGLSIGQKDYIIEACVGDVKKVVLTIKYLLNRERQAVLIF